MGARPRREPAAPLCRRRRAIAEAGAGPDAADAGAADDAPARAAARAAAAVPVTIEFRRLGLALAGSGERVLARAARSARPARRDHGAVGRGQDDAAHRALRPRAGSARRRAGAAQRRAGRGARATQLVGFVPQDDTLHGWLTVAEHLRFSARMRHRAARGGGGGGGDPARRCAEVMRSLGLEEQRDALVGDALSRGLSGGQRKRVAVAIELVRDPSVLFLDEPTSGLDASTAHDLARALRGVAAEGGGVAAVLHQPSSKTFRLFDDLVLLGRGRAAYFADWPPRPRCVATRSALSVRCTRTRPTF